MCDPAGRRLKLRRSVPEIPFGVHARSGDSYRESTLKSAEAARACGRARTISPYAEFQPDTRAGGRKALPSVQSILVDDITGKEIADGGGETISFAINGIEYTIDLDAKNTKKFYDAIAPYQDHATRVGRSKVTQMRRGRKNEEVDNVAVRAWAESNGYDVSSRGRIKGEIVEAFRAANA